MGCGYEEFGSRLLDDFIGRHQTEFLSFSGSLSTDLSGKIACWRVRPLQNHSCFLKIQARIAWVEPAWVSIAQVAEKIHFPLAVRKECRIQFVGIETGHRPAIQSQSARSQNEVCGLQRAVAEGVFLNQRFISDEVGADIRMWKELGKMLVEFRVPGDDYCHRSGHGFVDIAGRQNLLEKGLGAWSG